MAQDALTAEPISVLAHLSLTCSCSSPRATGQLAESRDRGDIGAISSSDIDRSFSAGSWSPNCCSQYRSLLSFISEGLQCHRFASVAAAAAQ